MRSRRNAAAVVAMCTLAGCGSLPIGPDGVLVINDGDGNTSVQAGERTPAPGELVSFGIGTIENVGDDVVVLVGVHANLFGDITLAGALVADGDRDALYQTSDDSFPPDDITFAGLEPLEGHVVLPSGTVTRRFSTENIVLGFSTGPDAEVSGMDGYCLEYRVGADGANRLQCWSSQQFVVCDDLDAPSCVVP